LWQILQMKLELLLCYSEIASDIVILKGI